MLFVWRFASREAASRARSIIWQAIIDAHERDEGFIEVVSALVPEQLDQLASGIVPSYRSAVGYTGRSSTLAAYEGFGYPGWLVFNGRTACFQACIRGEDRAFGGLADIVDELGGQLIPQDYFGQAAGAMDNLGKRLFPELSLAEARARAALEAVYDGKLTSIASAHWAARQVIPDLNPLAPAPVRKARKVWQSWPESAQTALAAQALNESPEWARKQFEALLMG